MKPSETFHFCPRCGAARPVTDGPLKCGGCGFAYYFNAAVAVAVFILDEEGKSLWIRRAREPAAGKLAMAGGFIDPGETGEEAARREIEEEVGLVLGEVEYLCSAVNQYETRDYTQPVLDLFFVGRARTAETTLQEDEVSSVVWARPEEIDPEELAFPSMKEALRIYLAKRQRG